MVLTCSHPGVADNVLVQEEAALAQRLRARSAKEGRSCSACDDDTQSPALLQQSASCEGAHVCIPHQAHGIRTPVTCTSGECLSAIRPGSAGVQNKEQLQQRVKGARGLLLQKLLAPLGGQGVPKARRPGRRSAEHVESRDGTQAARKELPELEGADLGARQTRAGLKDRVSRYTQRKDAEYVRHLESAHR